MLCGAFYQSFVCELGECWMTRGDGGMRKGHYPIHTAFAKQGGGRERNCVCVCVRERERERQGQHVGKRDLRSGKGFVWVTIAIGSGSGIVIDWDN